MTPYGPGLGYGLDVFPAIIIAFVILIYAAIIGLSLIAFGEIILVLLEIAFNTRKTEGGKSYPALRILSVVYRILGYIALVFGVIGFLIAVFAGFAENF